jgi:alkylhydroperoxidase/carboxymuconolactone decarboxylase family protein YurZ
MLRALQVSANNRRRLMSEQPAGRTAFFNEISDARRDSEEQLINESPVYANMVTEMSRIYGEQGRPNGLNQTHRILLALAMAVHSGSYSAIEWCMTRALNHGANHDQIRDAMDVALLNGGTFTVANFRFANEALGLRNEFRARSKPLTQAHT